MEEMAKKRVKDSETEQSYLLMHRHINGYGRLFGGQLVAWIDELAGLVGRRHCGHEITTANRPQNRLRLTLWSSILRFSFHLRQSTVSPMM